MSKQVVRIQGYTRGSLGCIGNECDRKKGVEHRNSDIDSERTKYNYSLHDTGYNFYTAFGQVLADTGATFTAKKNSVAFEGMVITADLDFFKSLGYTGEGKPSKAVNEFFEQSYKWALQQIGFSGTDKNIISAKVHYDEKTPHLHIYYVPIVDHWREKVYAKDENGKVVRTSTGSPVAAKDADGKILYRDVADADAPKVNRSEFWKQKGGKTSYRRMQDDFQEKIGKKYGLERGKVGSDREHQSKYEWKTKQLQKELKSYTGMKVKVDEIDTRATPIPLTDKVVIDKKAWSRTSAQAKTYVANSKALKSVQNREKAVAAAEVAVEEREKDLERGLSEVSRQRYEVQEMYNTQANLNSLYEQANSQWLLDRREIRLLRGENGALSNELDSAIQERDDAKKAAENANLSLQAVINALLLLTRGDDSKYKATLTDDQRRLIQAVQDYAAAWAKETGYPAISRDIATAKGGISKGVQEQIDALTEPKPARAQPQYQHRKRRSYEYER